MKEIESIYDLIHASFSTADVQQPDCFVVLCAIEQLSICYPDMKVAELCLYIKKDNPKAFEVPARETVLPDWKKQMLESFKRSQQFNSQNFI